MSRPLRELKPDHTYHVTVRCNNRRFNLSRKLCREVFIHAIRRAKQKYDFNLYGLCMMSNHVHYLIEPARHEDLPRIMHWLNWYSAMCFNRMLKRTGHFWEQRYHSSAFPTNDRKRALNTLRYIHANPRVAGVTRSFIYRYSNYGIYAKLSDDRLTTWHPAFLELGDTLEKCASRYRWFCLKYRSQKKAGGRRTHWGRRMLPESPGRSQSQRYERAGQLTFGPKWCQVPENQKLPETVLSSAETFTRANSWKTYAG